MIMKSAMVVFPERSMTMTFSALSSSSDLIAMSRSSAAGFCVFFARAMVVSFLVLNQLPG